MIRSKVSQPMRDRGSRRRSRILVWLVLSMSLLLLAGFALIVPAAAAPTGAPGNNGTVKIHDGGTDDEPIINNEPHVCTFHLHFFFADAAQSGDWWIESWPPTGNGTTVLSGTYLTDVNGEYRTPAAPGVYGLPIGHYKLFWVGRNDQNVKHKVFWVDCATPTPTPTP